MRPTSSRRRVRFSFIAEREVVGESSVWTIGDGSSFAGGLNFGENSQLGLFSALFVVRDRARHGPAVLCGCGFAPLRDGLEFDGAMPRTSFHAHAVEMAREG